MGSLCSSSGLLLDEKEFPHELERYCREIGCYREIHLSNFQRRNLLKRVLEKKKPYKDELELVTHNDPKNVEECRRILNDGFGHEIEKSEDDVLLEIMNEVPIFILSNSQKNDQSYNTNKKRVGVIVIMFHNNGSIYIHSLSILKKERGKGFGKRAIFLISSLLREEKEFGYAAFVYPRKDLCKVYEKYGDLRIMKDFSIVNKIKDREMITPVMIHILH